MKLDEILDRKPTPQSDTTTVGILGQKGTGKTYAMAILGQHLELPTLYLDMIGAFTRDGLIQDAVYFKVSALHRDKIIQAVEKGFKNADRVVLDMRTLIPREKVYLTDVMSSWAMAYGDTSVFADEISFVCPQSSRIYSDEFHRLVMAGRNFGNVPIVFSTQRPQTVHKDILALADKYLVFRLLHNLDRGKVKDLIGLKPNEWDDMEKQIMTLQTKEAFLFYPKEGERIIKRVMMPDYKVERDGDKTDEAQ